LSFGSLDAPSKLVFDGSMPGPTLLRGARAAGLGGACAGNWLCRRVRIAMFEGGGGMEGASAAKVLLEDVEAPLGCRVVGWLKRRTNELERAGRASAAGGAVKDCMLGAVLLLGKLLLKVPVPGAGKSLRSGS